MPGDRQQEQCCTCLSDVRYGVCDMVSAMRGDEPEWKKRIAVAFPASQRPLTTAGGESLAKRMWRIVINCLLQHLPRFKVSEK